MDDSLNIIQESDASQKMILRKSSIKKTKCFVKF